MTGYETYMARIGVHGETDRKRVLERSKKTLARLFDKNPSVRTVSILGSDTVKDMMIISTVKSGVKKIIPAPYDSLEIGKYVSFKEKVWIINSVDIDDQYLSVGEMTVCPAEFVFQSSTAGVFSYPYYVRSSSSVIDEGQMIMTPEGTRKIAIPFDNVTKNLYRDKRLMGETINGVPQCWKIIDLDPDSTEGMLYITLRADVYNAAVDNVNQRICDYVEHSEHGTVAPISGSRVEIEYRGSLSVKIGGSNKSFKAVYYNSQGEIDEPIATNWEIDVDADIKDMIISEVVGNADTSNSVKIRLKNNSLLSGRSFYLKATEDAVSSPRTNRVLVEAVNAL